MLPWDELFEIAASQHGFFSTRQAAGLGIGHASLYKSPDVGLTDFRGVHRFLRFPAHEQDILVAAFVWSEGSGVISHGSALDLHDLSDYIPGRIEMTLPNAWLRRAVPQLIFPFYEELLAEDVQWWGAFKVTTARKSVEDFIAWGVRPDLAAQALEEGCARRLFYRRSIPNRFDL